MKNTIRCCISCILPCGALDVIRIVHSNGKVEEISGSIRASEVMKAHPKHVLKKPLSHAKIDEVSGMVSRIVVVPPDAQLQRGKIYFLMPVSSSNSSTKAANKDHEKTSSSTGRRSSSSSSSTSSGRKKKRDHQHQHQGGGSTAGSATTNINGGSSRHHHQDRLSFSGGGCGPCSGGNSISVSTAAANLLISDRYLSEILREKVSSQKDRRRGRVGVWRPHLESISETLSEAAASN